MRLTAEGSRHVVHVDFHEGPAAEDPRAADEPVQAVGEGFDASAPSRDVGARGDVHAEPDDAPAATQPPQRAGIRVGGEHDIA